MKAQNAPGWDSEKLQALANEVYSWLLEQKMWIDTTIYYDGKSMKTQGIEDGEYVTRYNGEPVMGEADPAEFFEYIADPHILSMSFEGPLYELLNYGAGELEEQFEAIFQKHGIYYELGNSWNLTCYEL